GENGLRGRTGHFNLGRDVASLGLGNEIELRREVAGETEATARKIEALADNGGEPATPQVEGADCDRGFGGARESKISAELGVDPAAAYENAIFGAATVRSSAASKAEGALTRPRRACASAFCSAVS